MKIQFSLEVGWNPYQPALLVTGGMLIANGFGANLPYYVVWAPFFVTFAICATIATVIEIKDKRSWRHVNH